MKKKANPLHQQSSLRELAEHELSVQTQVNKAVIASDQQRLVHELQVHQIELEMQNVSLQEARIEADTAKAYYAELFDFGPMAYFTIGRDGMIRQTNFQGEKLLGSARNSISGTLFLQHVIPEFQSNYLVFLQQIFASEIAQTCELRLQHANHVLWVTLSATVDVARDTCLVAALDISERKANEENLQLAATVYMALEEAIMVSDSQNQIISINAAFTKLTGYSVAESVGQSTNLLKSSRQDKHYYQQLWQSLNRTGQWQGELWNRRKSGGLYLARLHINTLYNAKGEVLRRIAMYSDITETKRNEELVRKQANIDPLTGLPNRRLFIDRLQQAINKSRRTHAKLALMFLDLDHFKDVNDTLGHDMGDTLLKETAQRLKNCVRETDTLARPGGDEFTVIMTELGELSSVERVAQAILQSMLAPFQLKNERCYVSISIGIAFYPDDANSLEELLKKADQAMYASKNLGRSRICYFTPAMQAEAEQRLRMTNDLRRALLDQQIWVAYQPIVELGTGTIQKAEALIRWQHPTRGLVSPAEFIPVAEDTGIITELGEWVFHEVVNQVAKWRVDFHPMFQISINKSPAQFHNNNDRLLGWFEHLQRLGLPGGCIAVEITEGLLLDASAIVTEKLLAFKNAGMQTSLDDFGTGYSSLAYLKKYHIDFLKIDQDFVSHISSNPTDMALCETMILMAHILGMKVIAEGIETREQFELLKSVGCDYGQGYLFARPLSAEDFESLLQQGKIWH